VFLLGSWRLKCKEQDENHWFVSFDIPSISETVTKEGNRHLSNEIPWSSNLPSFSFCFPFLRKWSNRMSSECCQCVCLPFHLLNKLTELHEIWCQLCAIRGHQNLVIFHFLRLEITWRKRPCHLIYGLEIMYSNRPSRKCLHEAFIKMISYCRM
jgi:hypothetical protein